MTKMYGTTFDSKGIPQYNKKQPLTIDILDKPEVENLVKHSFDPLGCAYIAFRNALSISPYKEINIPMEIANVVISFLGYCESTWHGPPGGGGTSNPTVQYGTEALVVITPPKQSYLPSNCYVLDRIRYKLGFGDLNSAKCEIIIGIQTLDLSKVPGKGNVLFTDTLKISKSDAEFIVNPGIELKCGISYMFWVTCIDGSFHAGLIHGHDDKAWEIRSELKLTYSDLNYYATAWSNNNEYRVRKRFMNYYEIEFKPKV
eukprot:230405_1